MDKVTRGMSEAGRQSGTCCQNHEKDRGVVARVKDVAKEATQKVKDLLHRSSSKR